MPKQQPVVNRAFPVLINPTTVQWAIRATDGGVDIAQPNKELELPPQTAEGHYIVGIFITSDPNTDSYISRRYMSNGVITIGGKDGNQIRTEFKKNLSLILHKPYWTLFREGCTESGLNVHMISWIGVKCDSCQQIKSVYDMSQNLTEWTTTCKECTQN